MPDRDPAAIRRARRQRADTVRSTGAVTPPPEVEFADAPPAVAAGAYAATSGHPAGAHHRLGVRPGVSNLQVVGAFQRLMRATTDDAHRRELVAAFREIGPGTIRAYCPYGHPLALYDIDGETHTAYCAACYDDDNVPYHQYTYISGAVCLSARSTPHEQDTSRLPFGCEPQPSDAWTVKYRRASEPHPERPLTVRFVCERANGLRLHPDDRFSVIFRHKTPWRLLNHTVAETYRLDPYRSHRETIEDAKRRTKVRAEHSRRRAPRG